MVRGGFYFKVKFKVDINRVYRGDLGEYFMELEVFEGTQKEVILVMNGFR